MSAPITRGLVYRCPICGAELAVLSTRTGNFEPRCCNTDMLPEDRRLGFYVCPICGAELAIVRRGPTVFTPRCCNVDMLLEAA